MVNHEIIGDDMQAVIISLAHGDQIRAEAGGMMFMTDSIEMDAKMEGGLLKSLKRATLGGESLFITTYTAPTEGGWVDVAANLPGMSNSRQSRPDGSAVAGVTP